ncbi:MAG: hypothetical protein WCI09_12645, partial [Planctomycetota bacterium]
MKPEYELTIAIPTYNRCDAVTRNLRAMTAAGDPRLAEEAASPSLPALTGARGQRARSRALCLLPT